MIGTTAGVKIMVATRPVDFRRGVVRQSAQTCKINGVDPLAHLTDVLTMNVAGHSNRDIDQLLPWAYRTQALKAVARERRLQIGYETSLMKWNR
ncbi:hypothetical protein CQ12_25360 [Bradyrhizobium jicamae]|uniref:Transposase IS66 C-terminal domain-containing protein n=1 Tax=Bradyrhizobium jicamae TaxID=280332 RepID=A0A0R3LKC2_9BRAD|nr:hypothetical protein CQ12_25360 [Bradyrhizobium jicamae]